MPVFQLLEVRVVAGTVTTNGAALELTPVEPLVVYVPAENVTLPLAGGGAASRTLRVWGGVAPDELDVTHDRAKVAPGARTWARVAVVFTVTVTVALLRLPVPVKLKVTVFDPLLVAAQ
jgi:hypothetical protein